MNYFAFSTLLFSAWLFPACQAALPPGAIEEAKASATEVLLIQVESVELDGDMERCHQDYAVDAKVLAVNQTATGLTGGEMVDINSYTIERESADCQGWVGPIPPEKLEPGWCGYVYLNEGEEGEMELAVYGSSFEPAPDAEACQAAAPVENEGDNNDGETTETNAPAGPQTLQSSSMIRECVSLMTVFVALIGFFMI